VATNRQSGLGVGPTVRTPAQIMVGDTRHVHIDVAFAGEYELVVAEPEDRSTTIAYEYPPGVVVDLATFVVRERTISWWLAGHAPSEAVPVDAPDSGRLLIRPTGAAPWLGIFHADMTSARSANCVVALPDGESIVIVSEGRAYRVWAPRSRAL
jgi:hypothetical protein